jgi:hypothetical protein
MGPSDCTRRLSHNHAAVVTEGGNRRRHRPAAHANATSRTSVRAAGARLAVRRRATAMRHAAFDDVAADDAIAGGGRASRCPLALPIGTGGFAFAFGDAFFLPIDDLGFDPGDSLGAYRYGFRKAACRHAAWYRLSWRANA